MAQVVKFFLNARSLRVRFCVDKSLDLVHVQVLLHVIGVALEGVLEGEVGVKSEVSLFTNTNISGTPSF